MKHIILFLSISVMSAIAADFSLERDGLCFKNADPELRRFGPLGRLGSTEGVCQGMSGLVSAFHEHAIFRPLKSKMIYNEALNAVNELRRYHSGGCSLKKKIEISGFAHLNEFCQAHKDLFMESSIDYNADIAIREIAWNLDQFLILKNAPIVSLKGRRSLHSKIESLREQLAKGHWPLLLYYRHVVTVHSAIKTEDKVVFEIYDSNLRTVEFVINYDIDGLPLSGQKMIWDITPNRLTTACW